MTEATDGEGNGTPLQYSCLENPMDGAAWRATVHGVAKSRTRLSNFTFTFSTKHPLIHNTEASLKSNVSSIQVLENYNSVFLLLSQLC